MSAGDCHSNDPANAKGPKLRSWQDPIGSIRPMRGLNCTSLRVSVVLDWNRLAVKHQIEVVESHQVLILCYAPEAHIMYLAVVS